MTVGALLSHPGGNLGPERLFAWNRIFSGKPMVYEEWVQDGTSVANEEQ